MGIKWLKDLLVDSGVYAVNYVDHLLTGKHFNHGVRAFTLDYELLMEELARMFF